jgi:hypothetical protein
VHSGLEGEATGVGKWDDVAAGRRNDVASMSSANRTQGPSRKDGSG